MSKLSTSGAQWKSSRSSGYSKYLFLVAYLINWPTADSLNSSIFASEVEGLDGAEN